MIDNLRVEFEVYIARITLLKVRQITGVDFTMVVFGPSMAVRGLL
jgi:hypothetical protein